MPLEALAMLAALIFALCVLTGQLREDTKEEKA